VQYEKCQMNLSQDIAFFKSLSAVAELASGYRPECEHQSNGPIYRYLDSPSILQVPVHTEQSFPDFVVAGIESRSRATTKTLHPVAAYRYQFFELPVQGQLSFKIKCILD
jgi:hypothetical protein